MLGLRLKRRHRFGPLARLTALGAVVGAITASAVALWIDSRLTELTLAQVAARAQDQVQLGILTNVKGSDFEPPYSDAKRDDLGARLDPLLARARQSGSGVIRFNLFARDGTILYSDLASLRGQVVSPLVNPLLARALAGEPGTEVTSLGAAENFDLQQRYRRALEAYIPFTMGGRVVGVYEFYEDLAPIEPIGPTVWSAVAAGSLVLLITLLLASQRTLRSLPPVPTPVAEPHAAPAAFINAHTNAHTRTWLLTRREDEVLRLMADGLTYPQIAAKLVIDEETVRSHAKGVLRKLGQSSRSGAVVAARRAGIL